MKCNHPRKFWRIRTNGKEFQCKRCKKITIISVIARRWRKPKSQPPKERGKRFWVIRDKSVTACKLVVECSRVNQSDRLKEFKKTHEAMELWEEHGEWERWWCEKCGALYEWNAEMDKPSIEIPPNTKACKDKQ